MPLQPEWKDAVRDANLWMSGPSTFGARFEEDLTTKSGLLVGHGSHANLSSCGLFGVPKTEELLRVIFDARIANMKLTPVDTSLVLFSISQLVRAWASVGRRGDVYVLNVDYRHYYYQLAIPDYLIPHLVVNINGKLYHPAALPMGYRDACVMAQAVTWAIVLHREPGEDALGVPEGLAQGQVMPQYIPLEGGGAIFVLLDGVFIVTPSESLHHRWRKRLERNEKVLNVRRKVGHSVRLTDDGVVEESPRTNQHAAVSEGRPDAEKVATFAGVTFLSRNELRPAKSLPKQAAPGPSTFRQVASRMGRVL